MSSCWTCGSLVSGDQYSCGQCQGLDLLKQLEGGVDRANRTFNAFGVAQFALLNQLQAKIEKGFSTVASAIRWSTETLQWELQQQTQALASIDHSLKTPSETQANEWRRMADELMRRGVTHDAEELYRKALKINPLDYRLYVGLAGALIRSNAFDLADAVLEKSLPHAPQEKIEKTRIQDWRSHSLRMQGHIRQCRGSAREAMDKLELAVGLSPQFDDAWYDLAQVAAVAGFKESFRIALEKAIQLNAFYWGIAFVDPSFSSASLDLKKNLAVIARQRLEPIKARWSECQRRLEDESRDGWHALATAGEHAPSRVRHFAEKQLDSLSKLVVHARENINQERSRLNKLTVSTDTLAKFKESEARLAQAERTIEQVAHTAQKYLVNVEFEMQCARDTRNTALLIVIFIVVPLMLFLTLLVIGV